RVGSSTAIGCDVRVIATSNRDLPKAVGRGEFRQDLFFRLNVLPVHLPPLRDRLEDIPSLVAHFMQQISVREGGNRPVLTFSPEAIAVMQAYSWPGNVRELQNIAERAAVLCRGHTIVGPELIRPWLGQGFAPTGGLAQAITNGIADHSGFGASPNGFPMMPRSGITEVKPEVIVVATNLEPEPLEETERKAIVTALKNYGGHRQKTAIALGIGVRTLGLKLKKWKSQNLVEASL
ncbi:MAG: helix-turn-helix domain-containing protein, partial [Phycisphaerales bacterium]|nr:helix-turn-helix domain-containing protein [Phycisphaerales bacterium]